MYRNFEIFFLVFWFAPELRPNSQRKNEKFAARTKMNDVHANTMSPISNRANIELIYG